MLRRSRAVSVIALLVVACSGPLGIREDELECEQAVKRLSECCPGFDPRQLDCTFVERGCDADFIPAFSLETARCIERTDCATLKTTGTCARAQAPRTDRSTRSEEVCK